MAQPPSFLDVVGKSILDSASSIDAHIDAGALIERIGVESSPTSRRSQKSLAELKDLARRAPDAVAATPGAVQAILRAVTRLTSGSEEEGIDGDCLEPLQDALEGLACLLGEGRQDEAALRRGGEVADIIVRCTENGKQVLRFLGVRDVSIQHRAMLLLQQLYRHLPGPISASMLADPRALGQLMQVLQGCPVDYVRNESLSLLILLTASNTDMQTIVTVQGLVETVFQILEEEDLTIGGKVARDLLECLMNLVGNGTCQRYMREAGCINSLVSAMSRTISGPKLRGEDENAVDDGFEDDYRVDVPEEARWACLGLLMDAALALAGHRGGGGDDVGKGGGGNTASSMPQHETLANQDALARAGALDLCRRLTDSKLALLAKLKLVELLEALEPNALAAQWLQSYKNDKVPLLFILTSVLTGPATPLELRSALGRVVSLFVGRNVSLQSFLCSSLSPQLEVSSGDVRPTGRQVVELFEQAREGRADPERLWFATHLLLEMLLDNADVQSVCVSMPVAIPSDAGPAETFLELLLQVFSKCARTCCYDAHAGNDGAPLANQGAPDAPAAALMAIIKLLAYWLASCAAALEPFANSPVTVPLTMDLTTLDGMDVFFQVQVEGLACFLMGICINAKPGDVDVASLMELVAKRIGIEKFQQKVERLWRSEPLQRPPRNLTEFRWYSGSFRSFVREQQRAVMRRMVQLYVAEGVGSKGSALSEDVADQYKQLIRVQDTELREVRRENEQLRAEVEAFMRKSLQASSAALAEKMSAFQLENEALHTEVVQLTQEGERQASHFEHERQLFRSSISELEQQLRSVALGYEQVEQSNAELRVSVAAASAGKDSSEHRPRSEHEVGNMQHQIEELKSERSDMLELLGRIAAAFPEASRFVAPLGNVAAVPAMVADVIGGVTKEAVNPMPTVAASGA